MSNTNGQVSFVKSMNGILSFNTGSGVIISGDTITTNNLDVDNFNTNNIQGITPTDAITLYTNSTNNISLGSLVGLGTLALTNKLINIGTSANTTATTLAGTLTTISSTTTTIGGTTINLNGTTTNITGTINAPTSSLYAQNLYASTSVNTTFLDTLLASSAAYLWPNTTGTITIGSATAPIIGKYICTAPTHIANKQYVDSIIPTSLLSLTNIWTGVSNTFNNAIIGNTYTATAVSSIVNLFNNLTTGIINMGTSMTSGFSTGEINIGTLTAGSGPKVFISGSQFSLIATSINIGANITTIVNLGVASVSTAFINVNNPMKPLYNTRYVADVGTPTDCIGNYFAPTNSAPSGLTTNIANPTAIFINLPIGVWQINWLQTMNATTSVVITTLTMNIGSVTNGSDFLTNIVETNRTLAAGSARMYSTTYTFVNLLATNDVFLSVIATFTGTFLRGANNIDTLKIIRLA